MNDTTLAAAERIRIFADAVRAQLADLPPDEVDDLVEGLVGDLTDQAADNGGTIELGDPAAYAEELRSAAGLPERAAAAVAPTRTPWHERVAAAAGRGVGRIRSSAFGAWALDLLMTLRPVWWALRGLVIAALVVIPAGLGPRTMAGYGGLPAQVFTWGLIMAIILVSVQWGRGRWLPRNGLRHIRTLASIVAVLAFPMVFSPVLFGFATAAMYPQTSSTPPRPGLRLDGEQIGNLFVYDKEGNLIHGAQIYTDRGTPVDLFGTASEGLDSGNGRVDSSGESVDSVVVPFRDAQARPVWNVYPLQLGRYVDLNAGSLTSATDPVPPFLRAPDRALTVTPLPTTGSTMPPTASPTPQPSAPTPGPSPTSTPAG